MTIRSMPSNHNFRANYDRIFRPVEVPEFQPVDLDAPTDGKPEDYREELAGLAGHLIRDAQGK